MNSKIPYYRHDLGQPELDRAAKVLEGDILTTGDEVAEFERCFADVLHQRHAIAVTSCTGALHLALLAHGIGPGDEVITTPMSFVATDRDPGGGRHTGVRRRRARLRQSRCEPGGERDHAAHQGDHPGASLRTDVRHADVEDHRRPARTRADRGCGPLHGADGLEARS